MAPQTTTKLTYDDYVLIPDDGKRHEIIDGEHYVSGTPPLRHQAIVLNLTLLLWGFIGKQKLGKLYFAPLDVLLSDNDIFQPDLLFVSAARFGVLTDDNVKGAPDLTIEILSQETAAIDERLKYEQYDRFGVQEYWIVDGDAELVKIHRRVGTALKLVETVRGDRTFTSPLFPGFDIPLREIFEN